MKTAHVLFPLALAALLLASCGEPATSSLTTARSTLPSVRINATQAAAVYRQAMAAGAPALQGLRTGEEILTALEEGVSGAGIHADSVFRVGPVPQSERPKVIAILEENLGL